MQKKQRNCSTPGCRNKSRDKHCSKCYSRMMRKKKPMEHSYLNLKHNSKRRKKYFDLTFEDFKEFCYETDYMTGKGRTATSYSIDCMENEKGYTRGNIRKITVRDNSIKGTKKLEYNYITKEATVINTSYTPDEDLPF